MNSLVKVFSNFREFYSEINGATLTGAIDVIVVEQPDGTYACSPFHVRFGKLGVLRSREKVVDIEINGEPVNIHMKLGESGEAFFVEECSDDDEEIPENLATSPIPLSEFSKYEEANQFSNASDDIQLPLPRRNSIDLSKESEDVENKYENQISDYAQRRHTDNTMERNDLTVFKKEYTTQKIRQEWAEHKEIDKIDEIKSEKCENNDMENDPRMFRPIVCETIKREHEKSIIKEECEEKIIKEESKSKKKRRKKSALKKKNAQRKSSGSSSSVGSLNSEQQDQENDQVTTSNTANSSTDESPIIDEVPVIVTTENNDCEKKEIKTENASTRYRELDIHFFSDTEVGNAMSPGGSRPSTPVQSDTEFEVSQRDKSDNDIMTNSASWKWGELPTHPDEIKESVEESKQAQRNSMLNGMFSFMKQTKKLRNKATEGLYLSELDAEGMDPEVAALYFPPSNNTSYISQTNQQKQHPNKGAEEDRESGNGTSVPQSPNSMEAKNSDSDYEEGKPTDKYLDFVAMSLCGNLENGQVSDEAFDQHIVQYNDVCQNPTIFSSPNLVVRLNGKYYNWSAACPIVMTMITFQKPLPNETVEILMNTSLAKPSENGANEQIINQEPSRRGYYTFFGSLLRRGQTKSQESKDLPTPTQQPSINNEQTNTGTQTSRSVSPDSKLDDNTISSKPMNISLVSDNSEISDRDMSTANTKTSTEKFKKSLRLSTNQIENLNLKTGMNEVVFSVTTAYQGTTRCKCYLFKWKHNDKVVISDIDGTITRSDVLGHILPMVGKDWAQIGVAQLFSKIEENGYKLLYLSARAIGQSRATREYLRSIRQGDVKLPDGPLLLNPTSLISAFHREVIERKPEQFKIACLSDIQALFPNKNPFYAGYGNRINDVWAYRAVGIPIMRIFTINTKGELKHELTQTFQSTYARQSSDVDNIFPNISHHNDSDIDSSHSGSSGEKSDDEDDDFSNNI